MVFDQFCNEFATDDRDTEHTEIQLLMSLRKLFNLRIIGDAHAILEILRVKRRRFNIIQYNERSRSRLINIPGSILISRISKNFNQ